MKIFLIYGGKSAEHEVSIISAYNIIQQVDFDYYQVQLIYITRSGQWKKGPVVTEAQQIISEEWMKVSLDAEEFLLSTLKEKNSIAFPVLHGPYGEDGTIQGLFEVLDVPYVGAGVLASAAGMDKIVSKALFEKAGIPQLPYYEIQVSAWKFNREDVLDEIEKKLNYPMFVKPANLGSSVGISETKNRAELEKAIILSYQYDLRVVVEQGVIAKEIEVAVLGNEDVHVSVPGELVKDQQFYDYSSKYETKEVGLRIPAYLTEGIVEKLRVYAKDAFLAIGGSGLTRVDFFVTADEEIYVNEVNTFPGFTTISMYPKLWEETGLAYSDLIEELIQLGLNRYELRHELALKERN